MKVIEALVLSIVMSMAHPTNAQECREIRGRAEAFSATGRLVIWQVGTDHTYFVTDQKSSDLIYQYLHYPESDEQALFAFFTICPTTAYKKGFSQITLVMRIRDPKIRKR